MRFLMSLALLAGLVIAADADAAVKRSAKARADFVRLVACPATGLHKLPCKGWIIDHVVPLCAGGFDGPSNMSWQDYKSSLIKDKEERKLCALLRKNGSGQK